MEWIPEMTKVSPCFVVDTQARLHALLETLSESADTEPRSTP